MGIEPTRHRFGRLTGFEDQGAHQSHKRFRGFCKFAHIKSTSNSQAAILPLPGVSNADPGRTLERCDGSVQNLKSGEDGPKCAFGK